MFFHFTFGLDCKVATLKKHHEPTGFPLPAQFKRRKTGFLTAHPFTLFLNDVGLLRHVHTVQELEEEQYVRIIRYSSGEGAGANFSDILIPDSAGLLDISGGLGDGLNRVAGELELVLHVLGRDDIDTGLAGDGAHSLLAKEVTVCQKSSC